MKFRKVASEDVEEVLKLRMESFEKVSGKDLLKEVLENLRKKNTKESLLKKIKERDMFCLVDEGKIIGVVSLKGNEIGSVFVRYDLINRGIGGKLMNFIEEYAKGKGINKVKLKSAKNSMGFYLKRGYLEKKRIKYPDGNINFLMEKELK